MMVFTNNLSPNKYYGCFGALLLWLIETRIWIALGAVCFSAFAYERANQPLDQAVLWVVFLGTWFAYIMQRRLSTLRIDVSNRTKIKQVLFVVVSFLFLFSVVMDRIQNPVWGYLLLASLPAFLYPVVIRTRQTTILGIRAIPFLKIVVVAAVWCFLSMLPWIQAGTWGHPSSLIHLLVMALYMVALIIPFDMRDMLIDSPKLNTIAQIMGWQKAKFLALALLAIATCIAFVRFEGVFREVSMIVFLVSFALMLFVPKHNQGVYFEGLLDGTLLLWGLIFMI